ncbi:MAG: class I tRNA ligase family protein [Patescibacteria group bacterium]
MSDDKSLNLPQEEEKILEFWKRNKIFEKSLALRQAQGKKPFVFYEGPPYANGKPGIHHVLARIYKDIILRYKSMRGFYVPRKAGWDTHGLPVEIAAEKALGLKSKKDIEKFGIERFNEEARKAVWIYKNEWENLTERIGYWLDLKNAYITCSSDYIETLWWVLARIWKRGLLKKAHKVVPWCPRCGTALSSHELAQGYKEVEDTSVYVKFKLKPGQKIALRQAQGKAISFTTDDKTYVLSWTTTPWTLPGNVALAVGKNIKYVITVREIDGRKESWIIAEEIHKKPASVSEYQAEFIDRGGFKAYLPEVVTGKNLIGLQYEPLFDIPKLQNEKSHKIYGADFVTTEDGTGVVHTAVMYGEDDYELGKKEKLPQHHTVDEEGKFTKEVKGFDGMAVKSKETEEKIFDYLKKKNYLLKTENYTHEYPFCWRCGSRVIYYARTSWFIAMGKLRNNLLKSNKTINWVPAHVKDGRFGEWLREAKDWNLSRERYWGAPMPVWECGKCLASPDLAERDAYEVIGSLEELKEKAVRRNEFFFLRHGQAENNAKKVCAPSRDVKKHTSHLTAKGKEDVIKIAQIIAKKKIDLIVSSPLVRTRETAKIIQSITRTKIIYNKELVDINPGIFLWKPESQHNAYFKNELQKFDTPPPNGESCNDAKRRMAKTFSEINEKFNNKRILIVGHGHPLWLLKGALEGLSNEEILKTPYPENAKLYQIDTRTLPLDGAGNLDLHRPYVDEIYLRCSKCNKEMNRIKEVADVWFDSGAMPFAQGHWPFAQNQKSKIKNKKSPTDYPADYICEAMDQTRGWFYTLLSVATALGYEAPYKNVISLGLINDKFGQKMSKSKGNIVDPWEVIKKYGVDSVRWYFYTATPPGEPKNFDENEIAKAYRKFHLIFWNSVVFYKTYAKQTAGGGKKVTSSNVLDKWILARLNETIAAATVSLEKYQVREAALAIESFLDDLSRWYIRRSRRRFSVVFKKAPRRGSGQGAGNGKDYLAASSTLGYALTELAKLVAPFTPFFGEIIHKELGGESASIHLTEWPYYKKSAAGDKKLMEEMNEVRRLGSLALAKRAEAGIKVRQPLASLKIKSAKFKNKEIEELLKDEVNVKKIIFEPKAKSDVEFDLEITSELREEGTIREFVRTIQELRQKAGLRPGENIELMVELPQEIKSVVSRNEKFLKLEVGAKNISYKKSDKFGAETETKIDGVSVWLGIKKVR